MEKLFKLDAKSAGIVRTDRWSASEVRSMCIKHNLYTCGDCADYSKMLNYVEDHVNPSIDDIYTVAYDILQHSHIEDIVSCDDDVTSIMWYLQRECVITFYDMKEEIESEVE